MTDLLVGGAVWWTIPAVALTFGAVFGFFPGFVLRLIILLYPAEDPRRRELVAELYVLGRMERVEWVFQQLETALFEGVAARIERRKNRAAADPADETDTPPVVERHEFTEDMLLARMNHREVVDWFNFYNEDDVYSMIGTVLAQKVDGGREDL